MSITVNCHVSATFFSESGQCPAERRQLTLMLNPLSSRSALRISISVVLSICLAHLSVNNVHGNMVPFMALLVMVYHRVPDCSEGDVPLAVVPRRANLGSKERVDKGSLAQPGFTYPCQLYCARRCRPHGPGSPLHRQTSFDCHSW